MWTHFRLVPSIWLNFSSHRASLSVKTFLIVYTVVHQHNSTPPPVALNEPAYSNMDSNTVFKTTAGWGEGEKGGGEEVRGESVTKLSNFYKLVGMDPRNKKKPQNNSSADKNQSQLPSKVSRKVRVRFLIGSSSQIVHFRAGSMPLWLIFFLDFKIVNAKVQEMTANVPPF